MRIAIVLQLTLLAAAPAAAQELPFPPAAVADSAVLREAMPTLARAVLSRYTPDDRDARLNFAFRARMVAGDHLAALQTLDSLRTLRGVRDPEYAASEYTQYELFARVRLAGGAASPLAPVVREQFMRITAPLTDRVAYRVAGSFAFDLAQADAQLARALSRQGTATTIDVANAVTLVQAWHVREVYGTLLPVLAPILADAEAARYHIDTDVRIPLSDGGLLSAIVVRPRRFGGPQPTVLEFTIYASTQNRLTALEAAANGFIGIVATTRGKRASPGPVVPWERDADDAYDLIDWISRQPWSDGSVGMMGGSYAGFTQWAAAKRMHPALRTIVPSAAVAPGVDFPRENGVVLSFQYSWAPWVANDSLLDDSSYRDGARWAKLDSTWFANGSAYRDLDRIDGTPNPLFRRWLDHPTYDAYWRAMIPQGREYAAITIPVLTTTGYFDGAQPGALHYMREHLANNPAADHTLLIGPWDHFGAQRRPAPVLGVHVIDPVARLDLTAIIYAWFEHVMRGGPRPALLADRVNFQVMGSNRWVHVPSLSSMSTDTMLLHFSVGAGNVAHVLSADGRGADVAFEVDLTDRTNASSTFIDVWSDSTLDVSTGVAFTGEILDAPTTISGSFAGELEVTLNVRDVDLAVVLYELTSDGEYIQLSYHLGRASLTRDPGLRQLLVPGQRTRIPLRGARIISRVVPAGSRIVAVVRVNKGSESQINYGSGKEVSDETIADATVPLRVILHGGSILRVPLLRSLP